MPIQSVKGILRGIPFGETRYGDIWVDNTIECMEIVNNGDSQDVYLGGQFTRAGYTADLKVRGCAVINSEDTDLAQPDVKTICDGTVYCSLEFGDFVYFGGNFSSFNGIPAKCLVKVNKKDWSVDTNFNVDFPIKDTFIYCLAIAGDSLYVGGSIAYYGTGVSRQYCGNLLRLNATTGVRDTSFANFAPLLTNIVPISPLPGFDNVVRTLAIKYTTATNYQIIVGGDFINLNRYLETSNTTRTFITLNGMVVLSESTGSITNTFSFPANTKIRKIVLDNNNNVYACGVFLSYTSPSISSRMIIKFNQSDFSVNSTFTANISTGLNAYPLDMVYNANLNSLLIIGEFSTFNGVVCGQIVKLDTNGLIDTSFRSKISNTTIYYYSFGLRPNIVVGHNAIYVSCYYAFNLVGTPVYSYNYCKFDLNGDRDVSFGTYKGGSLLLPQHMQFIWTYTRLSPDSLGYKPSLVISSPYLDDYFKSDFTGVNKSIPTPRILKINGSVGSIDAQFNAGVTGYGFDGTVKAIKFDGQSSIYVCGSFWKYQNIDRKGVVKIDKNTAQPVSTFNGPKDTDSSISNYLCMELDEYGNVFLGSEAGYNGEYRSYRGTNTGTLLKIDQFGNLVPDFSVGRFLMSGYPKIKALKYIRESGELYVGGNFTAYAISDFSTILQAGFIRFDGFYGTVISPGNNYGQLGLYSNPEFYVSSIEVDSSGIYLGGYLGGSYGYFDNGVHKVSGNANGIIKLKPNSYVLDDSWMLGNYVSHHYFSLLYEVNFIKSDGKGSIYVCGGFNYFNNYSTPHRGIVKINTATGTIDTLFDTQTNLPALSQEIDYLNFPAMNTEDLIFNIKCIAIFSNGMILASVAKGAGSTAAFYSHKGYTGIMQKGLCAIDSRTAKPLGF